MKLAGWIGSVALLALAGCEGVPSLTFEEAEGGANDSGNSGDAASSTDAGCGPPACYGSFCNASNCAICLTCQPTELCCSRSANSAVCLAKGMVCR